MGAPPNANQPGKLLFGNGEHLASVGQHQQYKYYIIMFPWYFSTAEMRTLQHLALAPRFESGLLMQTMCHTDGAYYCVPYVRQIVPYGETGTCLSNLSFF